MDNLFTEEGMEIKPGYEGVFKDLVTRLTELRKKYKDTTGREVRVWPRGSYN